MLYVIYKNIQESYKTQRLGPMRKKVLPLILVTAPETRYQARKSLKDVLRQRNTLQITVNQLFLSFLQCYSVKSCAAFSFAASNCSLRAKALRKLRKLCSALRLDILGAFWRAKARPRCFSACARSKGRAHPSQLPSKAAEGLESQRSGLRGNKLSKLNKWKWNRFAQT